MISDNIEASEVYIFKTFHSGCSTQRAVRRASISKKVKQMCNNWHIRQIILSNMRQRETNSFKVRKTIYLSVLCILTCIRYLLDFINTNKTIICQYTVLCVFLKVKYSLCVSTYPESTYSCAHAQDICILTYQSSHSITYSKWQFLSVC